MFEKNDVRVSLMSSSVNLVRALLGSMLYVCMFKAKNRVLQLDHQQFVRRSKNDASVRSMFDKMVFDPSLIRGW